MSGSARAELLLVEDDAEEAELALSALRGHGLAARVAVVKDGAQALDYLFGGGAWAGSGPQTAGLRLILLDMKLPKVDGLEVLRKVKADRRTKLIPVVVLTSSQLLSDILESYRLGANSYLVKPVAFDDFAEMVARLGHYWLVLNRRPD